MIQLTNLNYQIKKHNNLKNINLTIQKGEKVGIIGESGSGKTTLAQVADRIIVIRDGAIVDDFPRTQLFNANRDEYTQALLNMNEIEIKK